MAAWCGRPAAADFRDRLPELDLNDFAIGGGVNFNDNVYAGASDSSAYYPAFADLFPSAFTEQLIFSREGGFGLRFTPGSKWEIGGLVRVQTLGFDAGDSPLLAGLPDRPRTIELGPTVGWRAEAVHVDWTTFVDVFRHQTGASHALRFSIPRRRERGYVIPEIALRRYTQGFVDYYFGVPAAAATVERPAYEGASASGWSAAVAWGVRVHSAWIVSGRLGVEKFGDAITASPIVDEERRSFLSLQLTYDRPLFRTPRGEPPSAIDARPRVALLTGLAAVDADAWFAARDVPVAGGAGGGKGVRDDLLYVDALVRVRDPHFVQVGYFDALHDLEEQPGGDNVGAAELRDFNIGYAFALIEDSQKSVDVGTGINVSEVSIGLGDSTAADAALRSKAPLPYLGITARAQFKRKLAARAQAQWSPVDYGDYSGYRLFVTAGISHRTFRRASFGVGYVFNRLSLQAQGTDAGRLDFDYEGPTLTVTGFF